jgi:uncharacterized SAM-binding protein YcdF (DUF218 family)
MKKFYIIITGGILLSGCVFFRPSPKKMYSRSLKRNSQYDAIIVPGVPFNAPAWDKTMQARVLWATYLYKQGITKYIIMSGNAVYTPYIEAQIMKLYAIKLGVPDQAILLEMNARHSTENVWFGYKLAKGEGLKKIALATDPFQTKMLYGLARRRIKGIAFLPVLFDTIKKLPQDTPTIDYQKYKIENFIPITESQNKFQRLKGTLGKNIDYKAP